MRKGSATLLVLFCVLALSFSSSAQYHGGTVPDSLRKYTLLIMKAEQGVMVKLFNKRLTQAIETHYDGPYELVGKEELKDAKYADLTKYRYTVDVIELTRNKTTERRTFSNGGASQSSRTDVTVDLFFTDRTTGNKLNRTGIESASYITSLRNLGLYVMRNQKKG